MDWPTSTEGSILATDLDGTLIPLDECPQNAKDLKTLAGLMNTSGTTLIFVTGRHLASVQDAIIRHALPQPRWLVCDVGTSIYQSTSDGSAAVELVEGYRALLDSMIQSRPLAAMRELLRPIPQLRIQEPAKQGAFKLSFYTNAGTLKQTASNVRDLIQEHQAPWSLIESVDPFNGDGLIDLLPLDVSKAYALRWLVRRLQTREEDVIFAGDSGNDLAALTAGYRAIVVGNASPDVASAAEAAHHRANWRRRLFVASQHATSGVLEGCRHYDLFGEQDPSREGART